MSDDKPFFLNQNESLREARPEDDYLHPEINAKVKDDTLTETQYFGFAVPEERIQGFAYLWHHPNLGVVTGGVFVWQGHKSNVIFSELAEARSFMSDSVLDNDIADYRLSNGYGVKVIEPLKRHHLTYSDDSRNNHIDLQFNAVCPPIMFGDGNHFEQPMKVSGKLVLRGKEYDVGGYTIRDRSWGKPRPEDNNTMAPYSWCTGVFNDDFAFNLGVIDQVENNPELEVPFIMPREKTVTGGWLYKDNKVGRIVDVNKTVKRSPIQLLPTHMEIDAADEFGRKISLSGRCVASNVWQMWPNMNLPVCLTEWRCGDLVCYGEIQEGLWSDYVVKYQQPLNRDIM